MQSTKVENMKGRLGKEVANQFIITEQGRGALGNFISRQTFQSYNSVIAVVTEWEDRVDVVLDEKYWDYSTTTGKYRNIFLMDASKKETQNKIDAGAYTLSNLN